MADSVILPVLVLKNEKNNVDLTLIYCVLVYNIIIFFPSSL